MQVTFTARGNLVVVPQSLAAQWEAEVKLDCLTAPRILVIADADVRRDCRTGVDDMRMCGPWSCFLAVFWMALLDV